MAPLPSSSTGSTWLSLLASSSLGIALVASTPAEVRADEDTKLGRGPMRLVVQTFDQASRKPIRSVQRAVTADELRKGVRVDLVGLEARSDDRVVAWVERGQANLEYDGRVARPGRGSLVGTASTTSPGPLRIVVSPKKRALALEGGGSPPRAVVFATPVV